ncbi:dienelactone hydrolase family protein [Catenuloplanes atrovinosus]|uniref:Dienelactone hydrolase n=1 Tax=Catenuloplanes atrovinosus TaxID=137266 RepID=A0AAE4CC42_9ACTN|nr:dienelactone hydrolase family protein [Catenuloplanes atrovinosus]MDR7276180.1 dienelactone hydrolase [Catenuloplanes atrovinosus]
MTAFSAPHAALLDTVPFAGSLTEEDVPYAHDDVALEGYLAVDAAASTPRPAVLILHDWTGPQEYTRLRTQMIARLGYVAFAADLYGAGVRPTEPADSQAEAERYYADLPLLRARVRAAYDTLAADPRVDASRIVVAGYCFGGSAALEFSRTGAALAGVVSFHGLLITHTPGDAEHVAAPILVLTGAADPVVPDDAVIAFQSELRDAGVDFEIVTYAGAPHAFTLPEIPLYHPKADARSWSRFRDFLDEVAPV